MTEQPMAELKEQAKIAGDDQKSYPFGYGHGRMPFFMKIVWVLFIALITWYSTAYLLEAVSKELS